MDKKDILVIVFAAIVVVGIGGFLEGNANEDNIAGDAKKILSKNKMAKGSYQVDNNRMRSRSPQHAGIEPSNDEDETWVNIPGEGDCRLINSQGGSGGICQARFACDSGVVIRNWDDCGSDSSGSNPNTGT